MRINFNEIIYILSSFVDHSRGIIVRSTNRGQYCFTFSVLMEPNLWSIKGRYLLESSGHYELQKNSKMVGNKITLTKNSCNRF